QLLLLRYHIGLGFGGHVKNQGSYYTHFSFDLKNLHQLTDCCANLGQVQLDSEVGPPPNLITLQNRYDY
ncbi:MAG: hypothetical protein LUI06_10050, partial [Ruminococcus sp.]|nr:hypothetical protein [Ruminococcus sp.]